MQVSFWKGVQEKSTIVTVLHSFSECQNSPCLLLIFFLFDQHQKEKVNLKLANETIQTP